MEKQQNTETRLTIALLTVSNVGIAWQARPEKKSVGHPIVLSLMQKQKNMLTITHKETTPFSFKDNILNYNPPTFETFAVYAFSRFPNLLRATNSFHSRPYDRQLLQRKYWCPQKQKYPGILYPSSSCTFFAPVSLVNHRQTKFLTRLPKKRLGGRLRFPVLFFTKYQPEFQKQKKNGSLQQRQVLSYVLNNKSSTIAKSQRKASDFSDTVICSNWRVSYNTPFYSCPFSDLAFAWQRG